MANPTLSNIKENKRTLWLIAGAVLIKLFFFSFIVLHAPESRFQNDSHEYLDTSQGLSTRGAFARITGNGALEYDYYRTPGYPIFLAFLMGALKFSVNGVLLVQIFLAVLTAWVTYQATLQIEPKIAFLSAMIVLYDPPVSIFSLQILAEALFLFMMALFMLSFVSYLKNRRLSMIALSALLLAAATYVRPTSYYLGWGIAIFIIYANIRGNLKKAVIHTLVFLVIVYSLLGLWQERNYKRFGQRYFCNVVMNGYKYFGLYKSYPRNIDKDAKSMTPVAYYSKVTTRSFLNLMARPGPFKYFKSQILSAVGNALAYPWMVFWIIGLIAGIVKMRQNIYYQFALFVTLYFIAASVGGVSVLAGERFRVPMVPFIAIISASGWLFLSNYKIGGKESL